MRRRIGTIAQIIISILIVVVSSVDMVGQKARLVHVLTIVAGSLGAGIPLGKFIERRRSKTSDAGKPGPIVESARHETPANPSTNKGQS